MFRKVIIIVLTLFLVWNLSITHTPKVRATSVVVDFITEFNTGISAIANSSLAVKEYVLDPIARLIARILYNNTVSGIIGKIQTSGRDGGPSFVQNWRNFQANGQYRGENVFRQILASTNICNYMDTGLKGVFNVGNKLPLAGLNLRINNLDPFTLRESCTLPRDFDLAKYKQNFTQNGGWDAWSRLMQPQNNFYGVLLQSLDELGTQRVTEEGADLNEAGTGSGYESTRGNDSCKVRDLNGQCLVLNDIKSPGDLLGKSAASTIHQDLGWLVSSDEIREVIIDVISALVNRLTNLATSKTAQDYASAPKVDTSSSDRYLQCINACPASGDITCQQKCAEATGFRANVIGGSSGGQTCGIPPPTASARYQADVQTAETQFLNDPANESIASAPVTNQAALDTFLLGVSDILQSRGYTANIATKCDGTPTSDKILVLKPDDLYGDIYDLKSGTVEANNPSATIKDVAQVQFVGWQDPSLITDTGRSGTKDKSP